MKDFNVLDYRKAQLEKELDGIRNAVNGRGLSFRESILGEGTRVDAGKLETLIDQMIESYKHYREYEDQYTPEEFQQKIEGDKERLLHHFLYLAILAPRLQIIPGIDMAEIDYEIPEKYRDILQAGDSLPYYDDKIAFYYKEMTTLNEMWDTYWFNYGPSSISLMDCLNYVCYDEKKGHAIYQTYDMRPEEWDPDNICRLRDEEEELYEIPSTEEEELYENSSTEEDTGVDENDHVVIGGSDSMEEAVETGESDLTEDDKQSIKQAIIREDVMSVINTKDERDPDDTAEYDEDEALALAQYDYERYIQEEEERKEILTKEGEAYRAWKDTIPDQDALWEIYMEFRGLYMNKDIGDFARNLGKHIEELIDAYLYESDLSPYSLGKSYGLVADRIENTVAHLNHELQRARKLSWK